MLNHFYWFFLEKRQISCTFTNEILYFFILFLELNHKWWINYFLKPFERVWWWQNATQPRNDFNVYFSLMLHGDGLKTQIWNDKHMLMWQSYRNERNRPCKGLGKYIYKSLVCSFLYNYTFVPFFFPKLNQNKMYLFFSVC